MGRIQDWNITRWEPLQFPSTVLYQVTRGLPRDLGAQERVRKQTIDYCKGLQQSYGEKTHTGTILRVYTVKIPANRT